MKPMKICLWFSEEALEAARFYVSLFPDGELGQVTYFTKEGFETHGRPEGSVMTAEFRVNGTDFIALNGGPEYKFDEAISLVIPCESQEEIDHFWEALSQDGSESECGWLKDRFGVSWQITSVELPRMLRDSDSNKRERVMSSLLTMKKLKIDALREAYRG